METAIRSDKQARIEELIASASSLPALPAAAARIIKLSEDEYAVVSDLVKAIQLDPILSAKILRVANSALYGRSGKVETLTQASTLLGFGGTLNLALSLSVSDSLLSCPTTGVDLERFWRRSLLAAGTARLFGQMVMPRQTEALFFAALMQDLGMLIVDGAQPGLYHEGIDQTDHDSLVAYETQELSMTHADVGAAMALEWGFSERMANALRLSHAEYKMDEDADEDALFVAIVSVTGPFADYLIYSDGKDILQLLGRARDAIGVSPAKVYEIFQKMTDMVPKLESLFSTDLLSQEKLEMFARQAGEQLDEQQVS